VKTVRIALVPDGLIATTFWQQTAVVERVNVQRLKSTCANGWNATEGVVEDLGGR